VRDQDSHPYKTKGNIPYPCNVTAYPKSQESSIALDIKFTPLAAAVTNAYVSIIIGFLDHTC
jgi:hypothetical protein